MKRKYKILIISVSVIVLAVAIVLGLCHFFPAKVPPKSVKMAIEQERTFGGFYDVIWYNEVGSWDTGTFDDFCTWQYVGKYGNTYAFIKRETYIHGTEVAPEEVLVLGLPREVYFPFYIEIMLYNKQGFTAEELYGEDWERYTYDYRVNADTVLHCVRMHGITNREDWLSDKQLERLTRDIEELAEEYQSLKFLP